MTSTRRRRGSGSGGRLRTGEGSAPCGRLHRKLEATDVILSSHAKKLAFVLDQNFVFGRNKKWTFFVNIN